MDCPTYSDFELLAARGNLIPVYRELDADLETPVSVYLKLRGVGESFLLESVEGGEQLARYSFIATNPARVLTLCGNRITLRDYTRTETLSGGTDFRAAAFLRRREISLENCEWQ